MNEHLDKMLNDKNYDRESYVSMYGAFKKADIQFIKRYVDEKESIEVKFKRYMELRGLWSLGFDDMQWGGTEEQREEYYDLHGELWEYLGCEPL